MHKKILIVGGVAGGATVAARLRRLDEDAEIILFERDAFVSFANCGLPYYIGDVIKDRSQLVLQNPQKFKDRFNIDVRTHSEVIQVNAKSKTLTIRPASGVPYTENYTHLVLSPGAKPLVPPLPGVHHERILTLRNVPDSDRIKELIDSGHIQRATVIGGGFIGIEMAENLALRDVAVSLVEAAPHILATFDREMAGFLEKELARAGVDLYLGKKATAFLAEDDRMIVQLDSEEKIISDLVILAIGIQPETHFLNDSGIALDERGFIKVNDQLQTNHPEVYALGDAIKVDHLVYHQPASIPLAGPANRQGRLVANNICGKTQKFQGAMGTAILQVFDLNAACTGSSEQVLMAHNIPTQSLYIHPNSHAGYYPGSTPLTIKLIYNPTDERILGAQVLGYEAVDKFIDVIASVIHFKGTIRDLADLELSYAPPFSSAKSPINMAGFVGLNISEKLMPVARFEEALKLDTTSQQLLDVRDDIEVANKKLEHSIHIPLNDLRHGKHLEKLDKNKEILVYCAVGVRGYIATRYLLAKGYNARNILGGMKLEPGFSQTSSKNHADKATASVVTPLMSDKVATLDLTGLQCPGPLMAIKKHIDNTEVGAIVQVQVSDPGFLHDVKGWCDSTGNELLSVNSSKGIIHAQIRKNPPKTDAGMLHKLEDQTIVVFSNDLDKAIAAFIIANGAAAMGKKVSLFFTFWGLSVIKKPNPSHVGKKNFMEKMFTMMLPKHSGKLPISKMNMGGLGAKMIRGVMKQKSVISLEELMQQAQENGIEMIACTMSMDVMGVKAEELIDGISLGGVGYYLNKAETANKNLFI
ncbi:DsrE/DsrF/DrsH-like family protein [Entomospira entomophila]|uniref:FAD-dependent oxidoreductase n=1 Tax=Entomospira entomophila TaxID=2719988 RepID=A0A968G9U6_9SPIO|nr:DsrE/DsrF/DrsH-like family protein [Entomospira entomophilus]NIZ41253.1 FAD-dependent oxidoreductase [Entomospira entomophilus]WDI35458.1 DsrE/DsrF/DrsH-like family protein [Entomospira entomophilus]